jgi:hypothetical protein
MLFAKSWMAEKINKSDSVIFGRSAGDIFFISLSIVLCIFLGSTSSVQATHIVQPWVQSKTYV